MSTLEAQKACRLGLNKARPAIAHKGQGLGLARSLRLPELANMVNPGFAKSVQIEVLSELRNTEIHKNINVLTHSISLTVNLHTEDSRRNTCYVN